MVISTNNINSPTALQMTTKNLRDCQKKAVINMLHFNVNNKDENEGMSTWKILILDSVGQRILSPLLKVSELRDHGVTLYLQLHSDRQPIVDVPAVYLVEPTAENIARIGLDLQANLYESFYLNFTSSIPRTLLEELACNSIQNGASALISKVYDQYLNFITLENNLFTLNMPDTYTILNKASSSQSLIDATLDQISASLFSMLLTMGGQPPLIYASKGTSAEYLGEKLDMRIKNYLVNAKTSYLGTQHDITIEDSLQRPLLLLVDRAFDVATMFRHTSTYNALVHDVLGMKLNRVTVMKGGDNKIYDIDSKDVFWHNNSSLPFPNVAENVDSALNQYKSDMQQVTRNAGGNNIQNVDDLGSASGMMTADELKMAISVLPELTERKRIIDSHLQISTALLEEIKNRDLGNLFHLEQELAELSKQKIVEALRAKEGTPIDKMRFFLVYYLTAQEVSKEDMSMFEVILKELNCDLKPLEYCKKVKAFQKMSQRNGLSLETGQTAAKPTGTSDFFQSFGTKISGGVLGNMLSSVKNLLPESADTPLTKLVEAAIESATGASSGTASALRSLAGGSTPKDDIFTSFDPKSGRAPRTTQSSNAPQRTAYNHLIVFIVGGSNYSEYNHVEEWMKKRQIKMSTTFGSTDLLTGNEFLSILSNIDQ